ncbi:MAG: hypothetical protein WBG48_17055 [Pricia sp.]
MLDTQNKIIIVDDNQDQLEKLGKSFFKNGLGCRTFIYSNDYDKPLKNVRVAFFDINLTAKRVDHNYDNSADLIKHNSGVFNDLANAINLYISKDNGPYALIFWTANKIVIDAFVEYVRNPERGFKDTAFPLFIDCIDKDQFDNEEYDSLSDKVMELLNDQSISFLFDFENNVNKACSETVNKFYSIIPKGDSWADSSTFKDNLGKILSKIAASTLGFEYSKENPLKAINEGLLPLLNNEISKIESATDWKELMKPLFSAKRFNEIELPENILQQDVNGIFHIEKGSGMKDVRGTVLPINEDEGLLASLNILNKNEWFNNIIPFLSSQNQEKKTVRENSQLIAVEISAACDYSNQKKRINKYILGFITPAIDVSSHLDKSRRSDSSYHVGGCTFKFENKSFQIWLNLNYVFGCAIDDSRLGEPLFVLKKEIMDMIGNKYASHISRIGITSF